MKLYFNADEIFEMAEEIERQGTRFYQKAATIFDEAEVKNMLNGLAAMEVGHEKMFAGMRAKILSDTYKGYDVDEMAAAYIRAFTEGKVFDYKKGMVDLITASSSLKDILKIAIEAEKNSIVFYTGIKSVVPEVLGHETLDSIIAEEMKHIVMLTEKLTTC